MLRNSVARQVHLPFSALDSSPVYYQKVFSNIKIIILDIDGFVWAGADALPAEVTFWHVIPNR
jgi:hypothetical protein